MFCVREKFTKKEIRTPNVRICSHEPYTFGYAALLMRAREHSEKYVSFFGYFKIMYLELKKYRGRRIDLDILAENQKVLQSYQQIVALILFQMFTGNVSTEAF